MPTVGRSDIFLSRLHKIVKFLSKPLDFFAQA